MDLLELFRILRVDRYQNIGRASFKTISFADQGDWTMEKALEGLKTAGCAVETSGGIKDGKLVVDKQVPELNRKWGDMDRVPPSIIRS